MGAVDANDVRCDFSNWGPGLTVFAPGDGVESAWIGGGGNSSAVLRGTSMAVLHVAGLAAYLMDVYGPHTPAAMKKRIVNLATTGLVRDAGAGSPNRIAFNGNRIEL